MSMPRWTLLLGCFFVLLGIGFYVGTDRQSVTALIPTFLGVPLVATALWARREKARAAAMHVAAVIALLGLAGTASGLVKAVRLVAGQVVERPEAAIAQALVALASLGYLVLSIRSFVLARRARTAP